MIEVMYNPEDAGRTITNSKGRQVVLRKYHLTKEEIKRLKNKWIEDTKDCPEELFIKAGKHFFNPYRKGIYYYQLQAMFLLGSNEWHRFSDILDKTREYYIHCAGGYRSMIACSILKRMGFDSLFDIKGGFAQIRKSELEII